MAGTHTHETNHPAGKAHTMKALYEPTAEHAAKIYAKHVGDHGHSGGWIHTHTGRIIVQGWHAYTQRLIANRIVVAKNVNGETRYAINWSRGRDSVSTITCDHHACPTVAGGLYGMTA